MMRYKEYYVLKKSFQGVPAGTNVRIHDWNSAAVQISLRGDLMWISKPEFESIFFC